MIRFTIVFLFFTNIAFSQKPIVFDEKLDEFLNVRDFTIDSLETEAYFSIQSPNQTFSQIVKIVKINNKWSKPVLMPFCNEFKYLEPFLAPDGKRLYFVSDRPLDNKDSLRKDFDIWYVERTHSNSEWSDPINVGFSINSSLDEFYPSITANNNLYFTMESSTGFGKDDIYMSEWKDGVYQQPKPLDTTINSKGYEYNAYVSPDENFMLFTKYNEPDGVGSGDLYISRKNNNGDWQKAEILDRFINSPFMEYCPFYNAFTQTLYFTGRRFNKSAKKFKDVADFQNYTLKGENGLSKIYMIKVALP